MSFSFFSAGSIRILSSTIRHLPSGAHFKETHSCLLNWFNHVSFFQDESGSLSSGESDIGVDDDDEELLDDDDMDEGRGEGQDDGSQANSLNDSDNDFWKNHRAANDPVNNVALNKVVKCNFCLIQAVYEFFASKVLNYPSLSPFYRYLRRSALK